MAPYNEKKNIDDVFLRGVILGALSYMRDKIVIRNTMENRGYAVNVPFFFSLTGDERYIQDKFIDWMEPNCREEMQKAEGNYDPIPRGVLKYTGSSTRNDALTNPYVRSTYNKEENGEVKGHSAYTEWRPKTYNFDVEIICDGLLESSKIEDELDTKFYKSEPYNFSYKGFTIYCQIQFPEQNSLEKQYDFTYGDKDSIFTKLTFSIEIESYKPIIDETTEFHLGKTMQAIQVASGEINLPEVKKDRKNLL